jgi:hypothetical protein
MPGLLFQPLGRKRHVRPPLIACIAHGFNRPLPFPPPFFTVAGKEALFIGCLSV